MNKARDVMNTELITIRTDATVGDAIRCLLANRISGVPVIDEHGCLAGIVSEYQLLEALYRPEVKKESVCNLMTKDVITIAEDAALPDVANLLLLHRIRRVPVVSRGKMVGIISRRDLLRHIGAVSHDELLEEVRACSGA
jgi:CBS domain-containing protein